jgi:putative endonuclease
MTTPRQKLGRQGEDLAVEFLLRRGYTLLERNARTPYGEIDLIVWHPTPKDLQPAGPSILVFVEVKTRRSTAYGLPEESITTQKKAHLLSAAQSYLQARPEFNGDWRIDVLAIQFKGSSHELEIIHFENVIT